MHCEELSQTNTDGPRECQADEDNDRLATSLLLSLTPGVIFPLEVVDSGWGVRSSSPNYCLCISLGNMLYVLPVYMSMFISIICILFVSVII